MKPYIVAIAILLGVLVSFSSGQEEAGDRPLSEQAPTVSERAQERPEDDESGSSYEHAINPVQGVLIAAGLAVFVGALVVWALRFRKKEVEEREGAPPRD